jgi:hypothetical protein
VEDADPAIMIAGEIEDDVVLMGAGEIVRPDGRPPEIWPKFG